MVNRIPRKKYRCWYCAAILWSLPAMEIHLKNRFHKNFTDAKIQKYRKRRLLELRAAGKENDCGYGWESFTEGEYCPFVWPQEKVICGCLHSPMSLDINNSIICPCLIDRPDLIDKYRILKIEPGFYEGKVEQMELINDRLKFIFATISGVTSSGRSDATRATRFKLESSKTTAFEIPKRTI